MGLGVSQHDGQRGNLLIMELAHLFIKAFYLNVKCDNTHT